ncbi:MAG: hypothetical protein K5756_01415 [Clostridiales bacterium]|nr:hypothetical protein [Clostridiales bacterium]
MNQWSVLNALKQYTSIDDSETAQILTACRACMDELTVRLKDDADKDDARLVNAAAAIAYYRLMVKKMSAEDSVVSFKAGDVTVSKSPELVLEIAEQVRDEALKTVLPLLKDDEFLFKQVCI